MSTVDPIVTRVGWSDFGDYEHFGRRLYRDLAGHTSFLALATFAISGRELSTGDAALLDDIAVCLHVPEPRVWPLKMCRIAAGNGRFIHGLMAGCAAMDSEIIGVHVVAQAAHVLRELIRSAEEPATLLAAVRNRKAIPGFGVSGRRVDERVGALRASLTARGRVTRPYWTLLEQLVPIVRTESNLEAHAWGAVAAVFLDLDFVPEHMPPLLSLLLQPSFLAHAVEGANLQSPALRCLPSDAVRYVGTASRMSPRAREQAKQRRG